MIRGGVRWDARGTGWAGLGWAGTGVAPAALWARDSDRPARPSHIVRSCSNDLSVSRRSAAKGICPVLVETLHICRHLLTEMTTS